MELHEFAVQLAHDLGVPEADYDLEAILDLARDAAHAVVRPAAPMAAYLAGYARAKATSGVSSREHIEHIRQRVDAIISAETEST